MTDITNLATQLSDRFSDWIVSSRIALGELTVEVKPDHLLDFCHALYSTPEFDFNFLVDICGVDYLAYGYDDWQTESTTFTGFSRGVTQKALHPDDAPFSQPVDPMTSRFGVVYHLLSLKHNRRMRLRVRLPEAKDLMVDSVIGIWPAANWYEREAFDLYGILFKGHPDLRRLLTDYGFVGHPFRKDFPLIGKVEARYDAALRRVIYEPVSITPRVLEPKVIRHDNRYLGSEESANGK